MPVPLDEFPVHQAPLSMAHVVSSDRNAYDRYYFNGHGRAGDPFFVTGLGVYPNLGVIDAFATVRTGDRQVTVRVADALGDDRMQTAVGPVPHRGHRAAADPATRARCRRPRARLRPDVARLVPGDPGGAAPLPPGAARRPRRPALRPGRHLGGRAPPRGHRDRRSSRTPGSAPATGRGASAPSASPSRRAAAPRRALEGFWWCYVPLRFEEFALVLIVQESPDGTRTLNQASRVWPAESGKGIEQLGWPEIDVRYRSGTRHPEGATIELRARDGKPLVVDVETLGYVALNAGSRLRRRPDLDPRRMEGP